MAYVDIDDTIREVHGFQKQGARVLLLRVKGLTAQLAVLSSPTCAPVVAAGRCRLFPFPGRLPNRTCGLHRTRLSTSPCRVSSR